MPGDEYANPLGNCPTYEGSPEMAEEQETLVDLVLEGMGPDHRTLLLWHLVLFDYVYPGPATTCRTS